MSDNFMMIIGIFLAAILLFVYPLMSLMNKQDEVAQTAAEVAVSEFVNTVIQQGKITQFDYNKLLISLNSTSNTFDVQIELQILDDNAERIATGGNKYYTVYTNTILDKILKEDPEEYALKRDDYIKVSVANTNYTVGTQLRNFMYNLVGKNTHTIGVTKSAVVINENENYKVWEDLKIAGGSEFIPPETEIRHVINIQENIVPHFIVVLDKSGSMTERRSFVSEGDDKSIVEGREYKLRREETDEEGNTIDTIMKLKSIEPNETEGYVKMVFENEIEGEIVGTSTYDPTKSSINSIIEFESLGEIPKVRKTCKDFVNELEKKLGEKEFSVDFIYFDSYASEILTYSKNDGDIDEILRKYKVGTEHTGTNYSAVLNKLVDKEENQIIFMSDGGPTLSSSPEIEYVIEKVSAEEDLINEIDEEILEKYNIEKDVLKDARIQYIIPYYEKMKEFNDYGDLIMNEHPDDWQEYLTNNPEEFTKLLDMAIEAKKIESEFSDFIEKYLYKLEAVELSERIGQNNNLHTIAFGKANTNTDYSKLLKDMSIKGKGTNYLATNAQQLTDSFMKILDKVIQKKIDIEVLRYELNRGLENGIQVVLCDKDDIEVADGEWIIKKVNGSVECYGTKNILELEDGKLYITATKLCEAVGFENIYDLSECTLKISIIE